MEVWASILNDIHLGPDPGARVKSGRVPVEI